MDVDVNDVVEAENVVEVFPSVVVIISDQMVVVAPVDFVAEK